MNGIAINKSIPWRWPWDFKPKVLRNLKIKYIFDINILYYYFHHFLSITVRFLKLILCIFWLKQGRILQFVMILYTVFYIFLLKSSSDIIDCPLSTLSFRLSYFKNNLQMLTLFLIEIIRNRKCKSAIRFLDEKFNLFKVKILLYGIIQFLFLLTLTAIVISAQ